MDCSVFLFYVYSNAFSQHCVFVMKKTHIISLIVYNEATIGGLTMTILKYEMYLRCKA
jgi:hypothetical protein